MAIFHPLIDRGEEEHAGRGIGQWKTTFREVRQLGPKFFKGEMESPRRLRCRNVTRFDLVSDLGGDRDGHAFFNVVSWSFHLNSRLLRSYCSFAGGKFFNGDVCDLIIQARSGTMPDRRATARPRH